MVEIGLKGNHWWILHCFHLQLGVSYHRHCADLRPPRIPVTTKISFLGLGNPYQNLHGMPLESWGPGRVTIQDMIVTLRARRALRHLSSNHLMPLLSFTHEVLLRKFTWHNSYQNRSLPNRSFAAPVFFYLLSGEPTDIFTSRFMHPDFLDGMAWVKVRSSSSFAYGHSCWAVKAARSWLQCMTAWIERLNRQTFKHLWTFKPTFLRWAPTNR